jgi:hypothetical protein
VLEQSFVAQDIWILIDRLICRLVFFLAIPVPYLESHKLEAIRFVKDFELEMFLKIDRLATGAKDLLLSLPLCEKTNWYSKD